MRNEGFIKRSASGPDLFGFLKEYGPKQHWVALPLLERTGDRLWQYVTKGRAVGGRLFDNLSER